jgi:hypothetical protein
MIVNDLFESPQQCPECGGPAFSDLILAEKKDACYSKVRSRYKVWPSAYASGALVQCRKKGAANWGNKSEGVAEGLDGQVVFSGTGANGVKYEIIQSGDDFMIHANGRHIDSYGSLQRAMSVLKNEVPGLTKGVAEGSDESYIIMRTDKEGKQDVFAKFDTYEKAQEELDACLAHPLHTKYKQKFELKRKGQQGVAEGSVDQLPTQGADYSKYDTDHLKMMLRPGILHRNEARFKALIRKELQKREQQSQQGLAEGEVEKIAGGIRHHAEPGRYGATATEPESNTLNKNAVNAMDKALGVKWDRESKRYYSPVKVDEINDEKIGGRHDPNDFDDMVRRLQQRAQRQEKEHGPVDLAKLAQRLHGIQQKPQTNK